MIAAAGHLWLGAPTLHAWRRGWARDRLHAARPGRPARPGTAIERARAWKLIDHLGPHMSADELWRLSPGISRREAKRLLADYRRRYRRQHARIEHRLTWHRWGAVWTLDFTQAPCVVGGIGRWILVVRDVAGKEALAVRAVKGERVGEVLPVLSELFRRHGAPLVLKMDNGSAFIARAMKAFLADHGTALLYSPPRTPEYNGTCEAGHAWVKIDALWSAIGHDRTGAWAHEDLQHALDRSLARAALREGVRPMDRRPIPVEARVAFQQELTRAREAWEKRLEVPGYETLSRLDKAKLDRKAIPATLEKMRYLTVTRRRVTPPIKRKIA